MTPAQCISIQRCHLKKPKTPGSVIDDDVLVMIVSKEMTNLHGVAPGFLVAPLGPAAAEVDG